ncbi:MAG: hypothetical protein FOGNACKC_01515 [Anaerolineae bacterium]|nr:hypothetical protein [Anaerolineae bacterium]
MPHTRRLLVPILLLLVLTAAAGLRFYNLNWDGGIFAHPDERSTVAFYAPTIRWPDNPADLLNPRQSRLNPFWNVDTQERRSYTYGHFPLYVLVITANLLHNAVDFGQQIGLPQTWLDFMAMATSGQGYAQVGRALMALSDLFSVLLLFLIGRRLYGDAGGLLAAAFGAFTVLQIQLAHFFAVDPVSTTFTLLAVYGSMRLYEHRSVGAALLAGVGVALAVASKFSALPIAAAPLLAGVLAVIRPPAAETNRASLPGRMVGLVLLSLATAFLIFAVSSPFVLLDWENFKQAVLEEQGNMVRGIADFPFTRQYRGTPAYWYFIDQQLRWGMGWALGLLGLAGTGWVLVKAVRGKAEVGELLSLAWLILYFGPTGLFLAKFMRYMIPVVPFLSLFGAGLIVAMTRLKDEGERRKFFHFIPQPSAFSLRFSAVALGLIVVLASAFWSLAFVNGVYGTEHTWITFSRWIYQNVPDGSCIAFEHWDDRMPTNLPEPTAYPEAHGYRQPQLPMYDEDTREKYENLRDTLLNCDYVALATNRLWRTIPRLPERYPMSTRYYDALFSGKLGFELVRADETPPQLGPFKIDDQSADESFTVYDHPKPMLFKKVRQLSAAEWDALLANTWRNAIPGYVGQPTLLMRLGGYQPGYTPETAGQGKSLLLNTPVDQLPVINDFRWNSPANNSPLVAALVWWLAVSLFGLIFFPLTFWLFHRLPDRGYGLSRSLGLLLTSYLVWLAASLVGTRWLGNTILTIFAALSLFVVLNALLALNLRAQLAQFWREQRWLILASELVFGAIFLLFVFLRVLNPDLWHPWLGGEKMLEIGFLNAVVKSAAMPPYDPFFAGGIINYYYYGLFLVGVLIKLTGIAPEIAFNLAVPTLAGLTAISVFGLAGNVAASLGRGRFSGAITKLKFVTSGVFGILFVVLLGNLEGAAQFFRELANLSDSSFTSAIPGLETAVRAVDGFGRALSGASLATYNYWDPTRVIPETINEFPFFSFLFADLHPHMIGIPVTLLLLSLVFNWLLAGSQESAGERDSESANSESRITNYELGTASQQDSEPASLPEATPVSGEISEPVAAESDIPTLVSVPQKLPPTSETDTQPQTNQTQSFTVHNSPFIIHPSSFLRWLAFPFVLGAVGVINTWDLPTYLGLILVAFLLAGYRRAAAELNLRRGGLILLEGGLLALATLAVTYLLYLPFFAHYQPPAETGVGLVTNQTPLGLHLKIWGFFIFVALSWLWLSLLVPHSRLSVLRAFSLGLRRWAVLPHLSEIYRRVVRRESTAHQLGLWATGGVLVVAGLLFLTGYRVPAYLLPLLALALLLLLRREVSAATAFLNLLLFTGLLVLLGVEFFFLRDFLGGGDYYRMNTLFKFYIQVWVMFGVAAAVALPQIWDAAWRWARPWQWIWRGAAIGLLLAGLIYPVFGARTRVDDRFPGDNHRPPIGTLNGLAYMTRGVFEWPAGNSIELNYDYDAIHWLQDNVSGTPVIAEAKIGYYREGGMRVAAYTGLPSILGGLHQNEQRPGAQVGERDFAVNDFWQNPDPQRTLQLINQLGIDYIYIGQLERAVYGSNIDAKFEQLRQQDALELVYENPQTKIYKNVKRNP